MTTIKLTIEYDGTAYAGWQRQPNHNTIQAVLENALFQITQQPTPVVGAGRTDSGVHALGQVVSFHSDKSLTVTQWAPALNSYLPKDITVLSSEQAPDDFHARFSAKGKVYQYRITTQASPPALDRHRAWHFPHQLDRNAMHQAIPTFLGIHDFTSFRGQRSQTKNPVCTLSHFSLHEESSSFIIHIEGDRFLKHMVRAIVGTLVEVGQHKRSPHTIQDILQAKDRRAAGRTAPPHGLYLVEVRY
ncbi:MAG: tRNA pseudouridine(38-40) synthase TruA [Nitrospirota bacterium]|nr:tRNA pseudouridine(38-40) synthase TruA [Nitrospirota bacterium]MDH5586893.1 tRNA pseudouridine(38-40) synthase TruA [Nitrospirota bacterium]MDH5774932.1 tRNA pseudouridine(38-40) synthase TruA [Nitrospirota bacterium]